MNAEEARKLAQKNRESNMETQSKIILKKIVEAVKKGEMSVWFTGHITEAVQEELEAVGYRFDKVGLEVLIKW